VDANGWRLVALVAIGGALGSVLRYGVSGVLTRGDFPWGTFAVNLSGTFLLTFVYFLALGRGYLTADIRTFLFVGVCGGYTTFSTFGLETVVLLREGQVLLAGLNVLLNAGLCLAGAVLGALLGLAVGGG
jgi:fluoride exporter